MNMICTSCRAYCETFYPTPSRLMGITLYLCEKCNQDQLEPRFAIVLTARESGVESVADYIRDHRYLGDEISATELI